MQIVYAMHVLLCMHQFLEMVLGTSQKPFDFPDFLSDSVTIFKMCFFLEKTKS